MNIVANVTTSGNLTASNVLASNVFQFAGPEVLTSSGAMNPYRLTVLSPTSAGTYNMTLTNPPQGTIIIEKKIIPKSNFSMTVTENSNSWTIPASNIAVFSWVLDRWLLATIPFISAAGSGLYTFTTATFTPGGATGQNGPIISQARSGLTGTPTPSDWSGTYLTMTTQGIQQWTVPSTGTYTIVAAGAKGGDSNGVRGGYGRIVQATFSLTQNQVIQIVVGQMGTSTGNGAGSQTYGSGGGGGSYVVQSDNTPLLVAGGGGGSQNNTNGFNCSAQGNDAPYTNQGTNSTGGSNSLAGGSGGNAFQGNWSGGGGGGLTGNGSLSPYGSSIGGDGWAQSLIAGISFTNGALGGRGWRNSTNYTNVGGSPGGFGGGGGAANDSAYYPGGGGGYVGGDGTAYCGQVPGGAGGGGGYYSSGTSTANNGNNTGDGYVTITKL